MNAIVISKDGFIAVDPHGIPKEEHAAYRVVKYSGGGPLRKDFDMMAPVAVSETVFQYVGKTPLGLRIYEESR